MGNSQSQRRIIESSTTRHLLVLAPPGSGKTRTIAERVAYLLNRGIAVPEQIVAMTFTERAAAELTDRVQVPGQPGVTSGTFHRFCAHLLRQDGSEIGLPKPIRICDDQRQSDVLREAVNNVTQSPGSSSSNEGQWDRPVDQFHVGYLQAGATNSARSAT